MTVPIFRTAMPEDAAAILELESHYVAELEPQNFKRWKAGEAAHRKRIEASLTCTFIAEMAGDIVGFCSWGLHHDKAHIFNVYVHQDYRRYRLAKCLLEHTEEDIIRKGFSRWTFCPLKTHPAQVFIEPLGYQLAQDDGEHLHLMKEQQAV